MDEYWNRVLTYLETMMVIKELLKYGIIDEYDYTEAQKRIAIEAGLKKDTIFLNPLDNNPTKSDICY